MKKTAARYDVLIVGAGFSGTMVAVHLARAQKGLRLALVERGKTHGRGVAYGTHDPKHLLNVRADQMGAFPDDVGHFYRWARAHPQNLAVVGVHQLHPEAFLPRMVFGDYIQDLLRGARETTQTLDVVRDEIMDLKRLAGEGFELASKKGKTFLAKHVVLALGNFPPGETRRSEPWFMTNPYSPATHEKLAEPGDVLIIGTGLTSLDLLMTLTDTKREGKIHLLSRRGLLPQPHQKVEPYPPFLDPHDLPKTARALFRRVAREISRAAEREIDWRSVIDSLRPFHQSIWQHLEFAEQRRFLRHLQGLWDTHRHRCAPEIMAVKNRLAAEGRLICHQGWIQNYVADGNQVKVTYRPRSANDLRKIRVRHVLSCTGPQSDYRKLKDPLVQKLLARNLLAPDPLRMGVSTDEAGLIRDPSGAAIPNLYTLGSPQKGRLYESIAVPELRLQAADLAARLLADYGAQPD